MAQTPKQKQQQKKRRLEKRADQIVGRFVNIWNLFEGQIAESLSSLCDLKPLDGAVITANLNFQSKMSIIISMVELYSRAQSKDWKDGAKKIYNRAFEINADWRNVIVHNVFKAQEDGSIKILRVQAKRELKFPDVVKTKKEFNAIYTEIGQLGDAIAKLANTALRTKREIERARLKQPMLSLAQLGSANPQQTPLGGLLGFPIPSIKTTPETPLERVAKALSKDRS